MSDTTGATADVHRPRAYTHTDAAGRVHYLHAKVTPRPGGGRHFAVYFAQTLKPDQALATLPEGYRVVVQPRTGRPYARRG